jgi:hypothetical protein
MHTEHAEFVADFTNLSVARIFRINLLSLQALHDDLQIFVLNIELVVVGLQGILTTLHLHNFCVSLVQFRSQFGLPFHQLGDA